MITFAKLGRFGRLGNCQFQMAAVIGLALANEDEYLFPRWEFADWLVLDSYGTPNYQRTFQELFFHYKFIPYQPNLNLSGYFQSPKYWEGFEPEVQRLLSAKQKYPEQPGVCSLHVRRTDYLKHPKHHPVLPLSYYLEAMEDMQANQYWIFSDDLDWCRQNFKGSQFQFIEETHPVKAQAMMSSCENHIIANSSFSWWGAYLNPREKRVIAPEQWFGPALSQHQTHDLYPEGWLVI